ncbi:MAG: MoxR family ATPase [Myxococcales bacterium]|nr:MoxR family ATPase [Myxococcales bacterium]
MNPRSFHRLEQAPPPPAIPSNAPPKWKESPLYRADRELVMSLQIAMAMRQPLLLTGDPGCGKTGAAYWAAWRLGLSPQDFFHVQTRSDASAARLKYEFDAVRYFRESQASALRNIPFDEDRERFLQRGPLWLAFCAAQKRSTVLLLDEIDKAPRDFPNDLLHEFELLEFEVPEWPEPDGRPRRISGRGGPDDGLTLMVLTSNGERQLPDAFLRRCVHHHLRFDAVWLAEIVRHRMALGDLRIDPGLVDHAVKRFVVLQNTPGLRHRPGLSEFLVWLRTVALVGGIDPQRLSSLRPAELPYLGTLLKDPNDRDLVSRMGPA